ncbi:MAG: putative metal-binding motif-containing protein [Deltaproteobacteria bacterium]|nr:putative metal-binding motif-containing protein [Deltaproteobacteria bacterium]
MREQRSAKEIVKILFERVFSNMRRLLTGRIGMVVKMAAVVAAIWALSTPGRAEAGITFTPDRLDYTLVQDTYAWKLVDIKFTDGTVRIIKVISAPKWVYIGSIWCHPCYMLLQIEAIDEYSGAYSGDIVLETERSIKQSDGSYVSVLEQVSYSITMTVVNPVIKYNKSEVHLASDSSCPGGQNKTEQSFVTAELVNPMQEDSNTYTEIFLFGDGQAGLGAYWHDHQYSPAVFTLSRNRVYNIVVKWPNVSTVSGAYAGAVYFKTKPASYSHTIPVTYTVNQKPKVTYSNGAFDGCDKYKINATVQPNTSCSSSYKIYFGMSPEPTTMTEVSSYPDGNAKTGAEPYTVTHTLPGLAANMDYYYRVDAINGHGTTTGEVQHINKEGFPVECTPCIDKDGDGVYAVAPLCYAGYDCDDNNRAVAEKSWWYKDVDQDKYAFKSASGGYDSTYACNKPDDYTSADLVYRDSEKNVVYDCDDGDMAVKDTKTWYKDYDGDDYVDFVTDAAGNKKAASIEACDQPEGYKAADYAGFKKDGANFIFDCMDGSTIDEQISKDSYPGAEEKCDGEDNNCNGKKDETCCEPTIKIVKDSIWPKIPTTQLLVTSHYAVTEVKVGLTKPAPPQKCKIKLREEQEADSGGHFHNEKRPLGTLSASEVIFAYGENESKIVKYTGSEASGVDRIYATTEMNGEKKEVFDSVTVMVPDLQPLASGPDYKLKCDLFPTIDRCDARYQHKNFYSVREEVGRAMVAISCMYNNLFSKSKTFLLMVNDASLESGGLYDVNKNWKTPHTTHRLGTDVDIRSWPLTVRMNGENVEVGIPKENRWMFNRIVCAAGGYPKLEHENIEGEEHYHLYFYLYSNDKKDLCSKSTNKK